MSDGSHLENPHSSVSDTDRCFEVLRELRKELYTKCDGSFEFFDFGMIDIGVKKTIEEKLQFITRACHWHVVALRHEFYLKLLYTIDGYLLAITQKNPISTVLLARYLLELVATVSEIDFKLRECIRIDLADWEQRGKQFIATLYQARHSTTDEKLKAIFLNAGVSADHIGPIKIRDAIKSLTARHGFGAAKSTYGTLSNFCHQNGSGHKFFVESFGLADRVRLRSNKTLVLEKQAPVMRLSYPSSKFIEVSVDHTVLAAQWSAFCANQLIGDLPMGPFSDRDLRKLTRGKVSTVKPADFMLGQRTALAVHDKGWTKVGRNEPCPCGSGKKYKLCCWTSRS